MKQPMSIHIPEPCHEDWQHMTPTDKGRFCQSCAKQVVDFSQMSDQQVLNYLLAATGRICGRVAGDQLQRPLQPLKQEKKKSWWLAAVIPLLMVFEKASAQKKKTKQEKTFVIANNHEVISMGLMSQRIIPVFKTWDTILPTTRHISGRVLTTNGKPVPYASIRAINQVAATMGDSVGNFTITMHKHAAPVEIEATAIGYENAVVQVADGEVDAVTIILKEAENKLPEVVVTGYGTTAGRIRLGGISSVRNYTYIEKADTLVRKIFNAEAFKIFPNPAQSGQPITIETKRQGEFAVQLFDNSSKLLQVKEFDATEGATQTSFTLPPNIASGMYYIRLVDERTKKQYTGKIVVR